MKIAAAALACILTTSGCHGSDRSPTSTTSNRSASVNVEGRSDPIYPLRIGLRDDQGDALGVDVFAGHPVIVSMFYGSCPAACPLIVAHVKEIEASLSPEVRARTRVLLVSFDPERDSPAALRAMAERHHVERDRWKFAVGADEDVRQLANALGVVYRKESSGAISHNSVISVLDGEGRILARVDDPGADLEPLGRAISAVR